MLWEKDGYEFLSVINQQETVPLNPICDVEVRLPYAVKSAVEPVTGEKFDFETDGTTSTVHIPRAEIFAIVRIERNSGV